jgi:hypothetical protein
MVPVVEELQHRNYDVEILHYGQGPLYFKYKNALHHGISFLKKIIGGHAKKSFREKVLKQRYKNQYFDQILVIHPQYLNKSTNKFLKSICDSYKTFFFDSIKKMPEQKRVLSYFDTVFSYEKEDCDNYNFRFVTNFIPYEKPFILSSKLDFFMICSWDDRISIVQAIAAYLMDQNLKYEFIVFSKKQRTSTALEVIYKKRNIQDVINKMEHTKAFVDVQRSMQNGLSFRVFEAMGLRKKLITTNEDIATYDFYDKRNILIIDLNAIKIPKEFLETPYREVPAAIYEQYTARNFVNKIFD